MLAPAHAIGPSQSLAAAVPALIRAPAATRDWVRGTQSYLASLHRAAAAARAGSAVRLVVEPDATLRVIVGYDPPRQFMVSAPRAGDRGRLEQAILRRFCIIDGCGAKPRMVAAPAREVLRPVRPGTSVVATLAGGDDGLHCVEAGRHQRLVGRACAALLSEVRGLVIALHAAARHGITIDWAMPARPRRQGQGHVLAINHAGVSVRLPLPMLARSPELLVDILPWARARLTGEVRTLALSPPARLVYGLALNAL